jgi:hypothetical protein
VNLAERDKLALLGGSFALVNPMQWAEPFGLVMIEALATGTPVVATPRGAAPEIIDEGVTGYLRKEQRGLAKALVDAPQLDRAQCRAVACQRFDSEAMVGKHIQLYADLLCSETSAVAKVHEDASNPKLAIGRTRTLHRARASKARSATVVEKVAKSQLN